MVRVLVVLSAPTVMAGCSIGHTCTLVGCSDGFSVSIVRKDGSTFAAGTYSVDLTTDGVVNHVSCTIRGGYDSSCDGGTTVEAVSGPGGVVELQVNLAGTPSDVGLSLTVPDGHVATGEWRPTYQTIQPNGPTCDPTCREAHQSLTIE
jgi:hypothetical protein